MDRKRTRRSIVFHFWMRLTAITALFTVIGIGGFMWLEMGDNLETARRHAEAQARAAALSVAQNQRIQQSQGGAGAPAPDPSISEALGIRGLQIVGPDGSVVRNLGTLSSESALAPVDLSNGPRAYDARLSLGGFEEASVSPFDLLMGGEYGLVSMQQLPATGPQAQDAAPPLVRVVLEYDNIAGQAQTLFVRSLLLAGGILLVAAVTIWLLLNHFVARPLQAYNATAQRIARGEVALMPDLGTSEFAQLGQTIDDMADALRRVAATDALTGLYNVRDLRGRLPLLLGTSLLSRVPFSLLVCDLDNMKPVNDRYGHHAGDVFLQGVAEMLRSWADEEYTCWRTGGDEFVVAMPATFLSDARVRAGELDSLARSTVVEVPGGEVEISMSIGVAAYPEDGESVESLMTTADSRMYGMKADRARNGMARVA